MVGRANDIAIAALVVAVITIFIASFLQIALSNLDLTTKEIGIMAIALIVYVMYNEIDKKLKINSRKRTQ